MAGLVEEALRIAREQQPLIKSSNAHAHIGAGHLRLGVARPDLVLGCLRAVPDLAKRVERLHDLELAPDRDRHVREPHVPIGVLGGLHGSPRNQFGLERRARAQHHTHRREARRAGLPPARLGLRHGGARGGYLGVVAHGPLNR